MIHPAEHAQVGALRSTGMRRFERVVADRSAGGDAEMNGRSPPLQAVMSGAMKQVRDADGSRRGGRLNSAKQRMIVHDRVGQKDFVDAAAAEIRASRRSQEPARRRRRQIANRFRGPKSDAQEADELPGRRRLWIAALAPRVCPVRPPPGTFVARARTMPRQLAAAQPNMFHGVFALEICPPLRPCSPRLELPHEPARNLPVVRLPEAQIVGKQGKVVKGERFFAKDL